MKTLGSALRALVVVLSVAGFVAGTVSAAGNLGNRVAVLGVLIVR